MDTIRVSTWGKFTLRLLKSADTYHGTVFDSVGVRHALIQHADPEEVWRCLQDQAGRAGHGYFGFTGACARFLSHFPNGLKDNGYKKYEDDYKRKAKSDLDAALPVVEVAAGRTGCGKAALSAFGATNLLSQFEKIKIQDVLRGPSADAFVQAAARFAMGGGEPQLLEMKRILKPHDSARWTVATYLPFLWRPDTHMFLKPEVTKDFAVRVGHPFAHEYTPLLDIGVYNSLLSLAEKTEKEMSGAGLVVEDRIDVQSFIWVVSFYDEPKVEATLRV